ncbi:MAG: FapA family protein [Planctomycetota bacterium]|nr:FapA family protein [Planctomycetota bacterium]
MSAPESQSHAAAPSLQEAPPAGEAAAQALDFASLPAGDVAVQGDLSVAGSIGAEFRVHVKGNIEVQGRIEAASVECTGNLDAHGGIAGPTRVALSVDGNLNSRFIAGARGDVRGNLRFDREAINCELRVGGHCRSPEGSLIGGHFIPSGPTEIGTLGSPAGVATRLVLGTTPLLDSLSKSIERVMDGLSAKRDLLVEEHEKVAKAKHQSAVAKERRTEIMFELHGLNSTIARAMSGIDTLGKQIAKQRTVDLSVVRLIHPGVVLEIQGQAYTITKPAPGPMRIYLTPDGEAVYHRPPAGPRKLAEIARAQQLSA